MLCLMKNGNGCHHITLQQHYSGNFIVVLLRLLYSTLMKTFSDSWHPLVTTVTAIMLLLFLVASVKHAFLGYIGELPDK